LKRLDVASWGPGDLHGSKLWQKGPKGAGLGKETVSSGCDIFFIYSGATAIGGSPENGLAPVLMTSEFQFADILRRRSLPRDRAPPSQSLRPGSITSLFLHIRVTKFMRFETATKGKEVPWPATWFQRQMNLRAGKHTPRRLLRPTLAGSGVFNIAARSAQVERRCPAFGSESCFFFHDGRGQRIKN